MDQIRYADEAGFDSIWLRERHFHPDHQGRNFFSSPFVAASYIAARTKRVRIGIGARLLPLDHPIHVSEGGATVDIISNGRLDLGVARIGENDLYQKVFGIEAEETRDRFEESLEVIVKAWTEERFSYEGLHYKIPEVSVHPKPVQKPHPPIYIVGITPETLRFGARKGLPLLLAGAQTVTILKKTQENYCQMLKEMGYNPEELVHPVNRFIYVSETSKKAIEETKDTIMTFIHRGNSVIRDFLFLPKEQITYDLLFEEACIFGDPDYCMRRIEEMKNTLDLRSLILTFNYYTIDHKKCVRSMELFTNHIMPQLKNY
jgi:alkanesulfonate monooxygenase SsuD/methylene tetrahydromethanopterin reductase-like flavin-dependent oxidoreductase (luciferase family)